MCKKKKKQKHKKIRARTCVISFNDPYGPNNISSIHFHAVNRIKTAYTLLFFLVKTYPNGGEQFAGEILPER